MPKTGVCLEPELMTTSRDFSSIEFVGQSLPHFDAVRSDLAGKLAVLPRLAPHRVSIDEYRRVHAQEYLEKIRRMANDEKLADPPRLSIECTGLQFALPGYEFSLGTMIRALDAMRAGELDRAYIFGIPGHHAHRDWGHGYCLLNPLAAAAVYATEIGFRTVLMLDWDYHHGDGTQEVLAGLPNVHCISVHAAIDLYMSMVGVYDLATTTRARELGHRNIPILGSAYSDEFWREVGLSGTYYRGPDAIGEFEKALNDLPWNAELILIFSGYDAHAADCGSEHANWTNDDFATLTNL
ncbi:MAG: histone deacetylase, partial [Spirochaetaceae bacterium]